MVSFCDCPGLLHQGHGVEQAPEASGYLMRPRRFMGPDSFSLPTHRLHSFRDANCKSYLQRVFFAKMKHQRSNSIIASKHLAEDLVHCPGGALLGGRACTSFCPCCCAVLHRELHLVVPWSLIGDKTFQRNREWEDKGTLWKLKLQINSERVSGVLFVWFWSRV